LIVVSDTSPLNYLILIGSTEILPRIFGQVYAPSVVVEELKHSGSPEPVRQWASIPPEWLTIQEPTKLDPLPWLDLGEVAAIALAGELQADAILIDEKAGRKAARERGLQVVGTLGVLNRAAHLELIDLPHSIEQLKATNFHVREVLIEDMVREDRERKLAQEQKRKHGPTLEP